MVVGKRNVAFGGSEWLDSGFQWLGVARQWLLENVMSFSDTTTGVWVRFKAALTQRTSRFASRHEKRL